MSTRIAVIAGDGTGPEVVREALKVLDAVAEREGFAYETTPFDLGGARYRRTGEVLPEAELEALKGFDAIFLGALGHPEVPPGVLERGILLGLRFGLDLYVNLRPVKLHPGVAGPLREKGPEEIDMLVVRENTEDLYCGMGGIARRSSPQEVATEQMLATRFGAERCLRYAFERARTRKRAGYAGRLTLVHKTNVLTSAGDLWFRAFEAIGDADYPDIERQYHHVDACCMYLATRPEVYDTVVTPNMFGDIVTDLGAAIAGGMGIAASGNLNPDPGGGAPSMFEPVHGSSPDIAGEDKANPLAAIESMGLLLAETGRKRGDGALERAAERVGAAVAAVTPAFEGKPLDRSGLSTTEIGDRVVAAL